MKDFKLIIDYDKNFIYPEPSLVDSGIGICSSSNTESVGKVLIGCVDVYRYYHTINPQDPITERNFNVYEVLVAINRDPITDLRNLLSRKPILVLKSKDEEDIFIENYRYSANEYSVEFIYPAEC